MSSGALRIPRASLAERCPKSPTTAAIRRERVAREPLCSTSSGRSRHYLDELRIAAGACGSPIGAPLPLRSGDRSASPPWRTRSSLIRLDRVFARRAAADPAQARNPLRTARTTCWNGRKRQCSVWRTGSRRVYSLIESARHYRVRCAPANWKRAWFYAHSHHAISRINHPLTAWCAITRGAAHQIAPIAVSCASMNPAWAQPFRTRPARCCASLSASHYAWRPGRTAGDLPPL